MPRFGNWMLNVVYFGALCLAMPFLIYRAITQGKYRDGWREKLLGALPQLPEDQQTIWFHAVSVGEVLQLQQVVSAFKQREPGYEIVVSCTTSTGRAVAEEKFPDCTVCYFPLDFSGTVQRAIRNIHPALIVLVELELWPNFICEATRQEIPLALINGRISEKSFRGYSKIRFLMSRLLNQFQSLAVQSETYAERLQALGAEPQRVTVTGSIKFDGVQADRQNEQTRELRRSFGISPQETVFIAGSTQSPEEQIALNVYRNLTQQFPELRLIIVPRHQERFEEVAALITANDFPIVRRSVVKLGKVNVKEREFTKGSPVLLLDTLGELSYCWGLADFAFVGGSLTKRGGQNMIEPAAYAAMVMFGPNTRNFKDVVELLLNAEAARVVDSEAALQESLLNHLSNPEAAKEIGRTAQQLVLSQQGATARTLDLLVQSLASSEEMSSQAA